MSSSIPQTSGIYKIVCLPTGKLYIGSSDNLRVRSLSHWAYLRGQRHANAYLQNAWNKYGESSFAFEIIELILSSFLLEREQYWIDKLQACDHRKGFNFSPVAGSARGVKHTEESKRRMGEGRKGAQVYTDAVRRARSEDQKRLWTIPSYREQLRAAKAKNWIVTDPDGNEYPISNLKKLCDEHGLDPGHMSYVAQGKRPRHKGWKCRRVDDVRK